MNHKRGFELIPAVTSAFLFALAFGLGVWQIERGAQKRELLDRLAQKITEAPAPLPAVLLRAAGDKGMAQGGEHAALLEDFEYAPVKETGEILAEPVFFRPAMRDGLRGNEIFAALKIQGEFVIPVMLGFIADETRNPKILHELGVTGKEITFRGMLRLPEPYAGKPESGAVVGGVPFASYSAKFGTKTLPAFLTGAKKAVDCGAAIAPKLCPQGKDPKEILEKIPNNHLSYTITWWSLALIVLIGYVWRLRQQKNQDTKSD